MILITSEIEHQLQEQFEKGSDLHSQKVICKIFNPYGEGEWYLLNQDPEDPEYIWCIARNPYLEIGSICKSELENIRISKHKLPLERDLFFEQVNAKIAYDRLKKGEHL